MPPQGYPLSPQTIGEHVRKKRLDLGSTQKAAAKIFGVTESTLWNWEHGTKPKLKHIPKIVEFVGYVPFDCPEDTIGKLEYFKRIQGLSHEKLGSLMGRDPEQLTDWISGRHSPSFKNMSYIENFLSQNCNEEDI